MFSGEPEPPSVIPIICCLSISCALATRLMKGFGIFSESTMSYNSQSIAQDNRCQLLKSPETDLVLYLSNHPGMERLSKRYPVNVSCPETWLAYFRLT